MAQQLQLRKGTTAQHAGFVGAIGEVTVDTTKDTLVVHDGSKAGGYPLAQESPVPVGAPANAARSLSARFADVINVKDFGATGNGTSDDGPAIRAAFAHANTLVNSTIYFPAGVYHFATYSDGTSSHTTQGTKFLVNPLVNNTGITKTITMVADCNATIQSGLYPTWTGRYPNWGTNNWFTFGAHYNVNVYGIKFKRLTGGIYSPIRALPNNLTTSFGLTIALSIGYATQTDPNIKVEISHCEFYEFTKDIDVQLWGANNTLVGSYNIHHNKFFCAWGCNSASTDDILPSVNAHCSSAIGDFSFNECIGGPDDYTPISNTQGGIYQVYKNKDGSILSSSYKMTIIGNHVKNMSVESLFWAPDYNHAPMSKFYCSVVGNVLDVPTPVLHNAWYPQGIVFHGPNGVVADNVIKGAQVGIFSQAIHDNVLVKNNMVEMYDSTNRQFDSTNGILLLSTSGYQTGKTIQSLSRAGSTVSVTTTSPHNLVTGEAITITGTSVSAYNNRFQKIVVTSPTAFQFQISGSPATSSSGGLIKSVGQYLEASGNTIICKNANPDSNQFDGTPASWNYSWRISTAISFGGSTGCLGARIADNYMKLLNKQNPNRKLIAINADLPAIIENNMSDGFDYFAGTITGGWYPDYAQNNRFINGERMDALLVSTFTSIKYKQAEWEFAPNQSGWWEFMGLGQMPINCTIEMYVGNYYDNATFEFDQVPQNQRFQYTKLELVRGGAYYSGGPTNGFPNPDHWSFKQEHGDTGAPFISKVAFLSGYTGRIAVWVPDVSLKPNKAVIRSEAFVTALSGGAVIQSKFLGATDAAAGVDANEWSKINLQQGIVCYHRANDQNSFGGRLFGFGKPLIGNAAPTVVPNYFGQEFLDITNNKAYKAFGTTAASDWQILN